MKLFNRFCWLALLIGILIVVMMSLPGCGGKKKLVQKSESSTEVATMEKVRELEEKKKETKAETNTSNETLSTNENENVEADIADPDKDFELKKETKDGKTTWTGKNIKNLKTANEKGTTETNDTAATKQWVNELAKTLSEKETETDLKASGSSKYIDIEKDGKFPWWILILIGVVYIAVSIWRKTLNPLWWIG